MYNKVLVFANEASAVAELMSCARGIASETVLITCGEELYGAGSVYRYSREETLAAVAAKLAGLTAALKPDAVLCEAGVNGKLFAGFAAAALHTSPLCDISEASFLPEYVVAKRMVYGGTAIKREKSGLPAVIVASPGIFELAAPPEEKGAAAEISVEGSGPVRLLETSEDAAAGTVNLSSAKCIVGVGRGLSSPDNVPKAEALAGLIGAEIGCTRPVAEEEHWFTKDRYIGVSGCMLKPNVYLALGISGQVQHMVGINQAGTIFAVDRNEHAPIFEQADYCLHGDINTVLPKLIQLLK